MCLFSFKSLSQIKPVLENSSNDLRVEVLGLWSAYSFQASLLMCVFMIVSLVWNQGLARCMELNEYSYLYQ